MSQVTSFEQQPEMRRDFDRAEFIRESLLKRAESIPDKTDEVISVGISAQALLSLAEPRNLSESIINNFGQILNQQKTSTVYIFDTITASSLMLMDNERFTSFLQKRNINLNSYQTLAFPMI